MKEIWKDVVGFEGLYMVSNYGRVWSITKKKFRKLNNIGGYLQVALSKNNVVYYLLVHVLVAQAFIPNPDNLPEVNHKDENGLNNRVDNLEWCTRKYNVNYGTARERMKEKMINGKTSKPVYQYSLDGKLIKVWPSASEIQRLLGYNRSFIARCCRGGQKTSYGFIWRYKEPEPIE